MGRRARARRLGERRLLPRQAVEESRVRALGQGAHVFERLRPQALDPQQQLALVVVDRDRPLKGLRREPSTVAWLQNALPTGRCETTRAARVGRNAGRAALGLLARLVTAPMSTCSPASKSAGCTRSPFIAKASVVRQLHAAEGLAVALGERLDAHEPRAEREATLATSS